MQTPEALPVIARHILRYNHQSKSPFQATAKSLYHNTTQHSGAGPTQGFAKINSQSFANVQHAAGAHTFANSHVSLSARIAASKGDRERILKSIERAREGRAARGELVEEGAGMGRIWEEQVYPPVGAGLV